MLSTAQEVFEREVRDLPPVEQLRLAAMILEELTQSGVAIVEQSDSWSERDERDLTAYALCHASRIYPENDDLA